LDVERRDGAGHFTSSLVLEIAVRGLKDEVGDIALRSEWNNRRYSCKNVYNLRLEQARKH
jgi:hypothetical protein